MTPWRHLYVALTVSFILAFSTRSGWAQPTCAEQAVLPAGVVQVLTTNKYSAANATGKVFTKTDTTQRNVFYDGVKGELIYCEQSTGKSQEYGWLNAYSDAKSTGSKSLFQAHHVIQDAWAKAFFKDFTDEKGAALYSRDKAPAIWLLTGPKDPQGSDGQPARTEHHCINKVQGEKLADRLTSIKDYQSAVAEGLKDLEECIRASRPGDPTAAEVAARVTTEVKAELAKPDVYYCKLAANINANVTRSRKSAGDKQKLLTNLETIFANSQCPQPYQQQPPQALAQNNGPEEPQRQTAAAAPAPEEPQQPPAAAPAPEEPQRQPAAASAPQADAPGPTPTGKTTRVEANENAECGNRAWEVVTCQPPFQCMKNDGSMPYWWSPVDFSQEGTPGYGSCIDRSKLIDHSPKN